MCDNFRSLFKLLLYTDLLNNLIYDISMKLLNNYNQSNKTIEKFVSESDATNDNEIYKLIDSSNHINYDIDKS